MSGETWPPGTNCPEKDLIEIECQKCHRILKVPYWQRFPAICPELKNQNGVTDGCKRSTVWKYVNPEDEKRHIERFFDGNRFLAKKVADTISENGHYITFKDTCEIYIYKDGVYVPGGDAFIKEMCEQILGGEATTHRVNEVIAHIERSTYIDRASVNKDVNLLCVENGILNIKTKELAPHDPGKIFLNKMPVKYDPRAKCPRIMKFLQDVLDESDICTLQEMVGYCLYRESPIDKAFLLVGEGSNGKSTVLGLIAALLGTENIASVALQDMDGNRFATSELYGKMANIYADLTDRALRHTGKFKMLVGGDPVGAERKFKGQFTFVNYAKMLFSCNKVPETRDDSDAFYRRWIFINFKNKFEGENDDPFILQKLTTPEALAGFLNWALSGLDRLLNNGRFSNTATTSQMRELYMRMSNPLQFFVEQCLDVDPLTAIKKDDLYLAFVEFCWAKKLPTKAKNVFGRELPQYITVESTRITDDEGNRVMAWKGIKFSDAVMAGKDDIDFSHFNIIYLTPTTVSNKIKENYDIPDNSDTLEKYYREEDKDDKPT